MGSGKRQTAEIIVDHVLLSQCINDVVFWQMCNGFEPYREEADSLGADVLMTRSSMVLKVSSLLTAWKVMLLFWQKIESDFLLEFVEYVHLKRRRATKESIGLWSETSPKVFHRLYEA